MQLAFLKRWLCVLLFLLSFFCFAEKRYPEDLLERTEPYALALRYSHLIKDPALTLANLKLLFKSGDQTGKYTGEDWISATFDQLDPEVVISFWELGNPEVFSATHQTQMGEEKITVDLDPILILYWKKKTYSPEQLSFKKNEKKEFLKKFGHILKYPFVTVDLSQYSNLVTHEHLEQLKDHETLERVVLNNQEIVNLRRAQLKQSEEYQMFHKCFLTVRSSFEAWIHCFLKDKTPVFKMPVTFRRKLLGMKQELPAAEMDGLTLEEITRKYPLSFRKPFPVNKNLRLVYMP